MGNIRLFFSNSITTGMTGMLDKSQSHYLNKVMRSCQPQNFIQGLGWKLMQIGNKIRPKKLVK